MAFDEARLATPENAEYPWETEDKVIAPCRHTRSRRWTCCASPVAEPFSSSWSGLPAPSCSPVGSLAPLRMTASERPARPHSTEDSTSTGRSPRSPGDAESRTKLVSPAGLTENSRVDGTRTRFKPVLQQRDGALLFVQAFESPRLSVFDPLRWIPLLSAGINRSHGTLVARAAMLRVDTARTRFVGYVRLASAQPVSRT
jgi:hypothetical protein